MSIKVAYINQYSDSELTLCFLAGIVINVLTGIC